jgi:hypothetical protein
MKKTVAIIVVILNAFVLDIYPQHKMDSEGLYLNNKAPLLSKPYIELPLGSIKPDGWLKEQLIRQKNGLTGNLDEVYEPVMGPRNGWLGGDGDVWERGPYWIDGLLPLAYILGDKALIDKTKPWIEWTLNNQREDGYFGPYDDRENEPGLQRKNAQDWWPKMVMLKVLQQYYSATNDERVITLMLNYFRYQLKELPSKPLDNWTHWGMDRGGDNLAVVYWLYNITGEKFLLNLAELIHFQTENWTDICLEGELRKQWNLHCVNVAQGMKEPVVYYQQNPNAKYVEAARKGLADLRQHHGLAHGLYGADEMMHGNDPVQGSELCTAVEMMFSMETALPITGEVLFADHLERVAFNALPAQVTDNYDSRQYYQQANQVLVSRHPRNFNTAYEGTDQLFGVLTGYPCCTSNMHQGWPKFTQNLWYATADRGMAALIYAPSMATIKVGGGSQVHVTEQTNYPFDETIQFTLKMDEPAAFPFHLRIPGWCNNATVKINGEEWDKYSGNQIIKIKREWNNGDVVELLLPMELRTERWHENSVSVERGPLAFALKIGEKWEKVANNDKYGPFYYEVKPTTPWNYGLISASLENLSDNFKIVRRNFRDDSYPWNPENSPVEIKTKAVSIPYWVLYNGSAGPLPYSEQYQLKTGDPVEITLIPYGCTTLRISQFPVVRVYEKNEKMNLSGL